MHTSLANMYLVVFEILSREKFDSAAITFLIIRALNFVLFALGPLVAGSFLYF